MSKKFQQEGSNNIYCNGDVLRDEKVYSNNKFYSEDDVEISEHHLNFMTGSNVKRISIPKSGRNKNRKRNYVKNNSFASGYSDECSPIINNTIANAEPQEQQLAPSDRVYFLLNPVDEIDHPLESHSIFTEMAELHGCNDQQEWRETARWVKFEEDVEEGGNRWSKPHVATLSLHSLFELRSCIMVGTVILDLDANTFSDIVDFTLDHMTSEKIIDYNDVQKIAQIRQALLRKHKHQYESHHKYDIIKTVQSFADIGRQFSNAKNFNTDSTNNIGKFNNLLTMSDVPKVFSLPNNMTRAGGSSLDQLKGNLHFLKKLPPDAEVSNVLIGQVEFLERPLSIFIRLKHSILLGDLTEVPLPTRFLFIILGPMGHGKQYREIGRAIATLMSDEIFHNVAYKAHNRNDILDGIDEFLDQVTVLPPDEWDPNIRIEPPSSLPSQGKRKLPSHATKGSIGSLDGSSKEPKSDRDSGEESGEHCIDQTLKRTGRLFGGLIADVKRKLPFYSSDFKDALHLQCLAAFMYMYFAMLAPIVTFGGLLEEATNMRLAAVENLLSAAVCGTIYTMFSGQPLTMIGSTGPVLVFEKIMFSLCEENKWDFLAFRWWINIWSSIILFIIVALDASTLVSYITRFTEENFSVLISFIFIYEAFAKTIKILYSAHVVPFDRDLLTPNPYCSCKPLDDGETHENFSLSSKDYSFVLKNASKYRWKGNISLWTYFDIERNVTTVDWDRIPLTYCKASQGRLESLNSTNQCYYMYDVFLMSIILILGTFALAYALKLMRNSPCFPSKVREILSDFAVIISLTCMVLLDYYVNLDTPKLFVPKKFKPTWPDRGWLIDPFGYNPVWSSILALPPAVLLCILLFMDNHITVVIVNRKENKLKKGCGYHLDLFCIAVGVAISGCFGLPIMVAATVMSVSHVNSLRVESECRAPGEKPTFTGVREQRVTGLLVFIFIGISVFMKDVLKHIPMPVLYGVFLYMGVSSLRGVQMIDRLSLMLMPMKWQPDYVYLRHVPLKRVHLFTIFQVACFILLCVIKEVQLTSIVFPIMLVFTVAVRKFMEYVFNDDELKYLDDKMPEITLRKDDDAKNKKLQLEKKEFEDNATERNQAIDTVQTESNLHIKLTSGKVMKIPLTSIAEKPRNSEPVMNLSNEVNKSGLWLHIASESSFGSKDTMNRKSKSPISPCPVRLKHENELLPDDYEPPITINVQRPTPNTSSSDLEKFYETSPLWPADENNFNKV